MKKLTFILAVVFTLFFLVNAASVFAAPIEIGQDCTISKQTTGTEAEKCGKNLFCKVKDPTKSSDAGACQSSSITITNPEKGFTTLGNAVNNIITFAFAVAVLVVLVMLVLGAFEWITSGGDKEAVGKARQRIINALIGLAVLAIAFALARVAGQFTGLDLQNLTIPAPNPQASGL